MFYTVNVKHESEHDILPNYLRKITDDKESTDRIKHLRKIMLGLNENYILKSYYH